MSAPMEKVELRDSDGIGFTAYLLDGIPVLNKDIHHHLDGYKSLECYDDDVCIISFPKSGTHWAIDIVGLLKRTPIDKQTEGALIERFPCKSHADRHRPRLFATHLHPKYVPKPITESRMKMVYIYRNPKDVLVSYFTFLKKLKMVDFSKGKFESFFPMFLDGNVPGGKWINYMMDWQKFKEENPDYPILTLCYEEMKKDLRSNVKKIAEFLETDSTDEEIDDIAEKCEFQAMNKLKQTNISETAKSVTDADWNIFYRKGEIGDWKNWFTVAQNELFDLKLTNELSKLGLPFCFTKTQS